MRIYNLTRLFAELSKKEKRITIPTMFTILRIALAPAVAVSMFLGSWNSAFILFFIAVLTDFLDGILARLLNAKTILGACLDPLADKLLIVSCFFSLAFVQSPLFSIPIWFVLFVLVKELILIAGVTFLYYKNGVFEIQPTYLGKLAMLAQTTFIIWLFACYFFGWVPVRTYYGMLIMVTVIVGAVLIQYVNIGRKLV